MSTVYYPAIIERGALAEPSELDQVELDPDIEEVARLLVRAERKGKAVRINITLDEGLLAAIDKVAGNRSGFLAEAARGENRDSIYLLRARLPPP